MTYAITVTISEGERLALRNRDPAAWNALDTRLTDAVAALSSSADYVEDVATDNAIKLYWRGTFIGHAARYKRDFGPFWQVNLKCEGYLKSIRRNDYQALLDAVSDFMRGKDDA